MGRYELRKTPPSLDELRSANGFLVPRTFADLMSVCHARASSQGIDFDDYYFPFMGYALSGRTLDAVFEREGPSSVVIYATCPVCWPALAA